MSDIEAFAGTHPGTCPVCDASAGQPAESPSQSCPRCGHLLWFSSREVDGVTVIRLLDNRVAVLEMLEFLDQALIEGRMSRVVLNFGSIQQVSSAALGKMIKLQGHAGNVRGSLRLCALHPDLRKVFRITRLDTIFDLDDTEAESLAAFAAAVDA